MNIYDINLSKITDQYVDYLKEQEKMNLEIASEFLVMATTLLFLKSKIFYQNKKKTKKKLQKKNLSEELQNTKI